MPRGGQRSGSGRPSGSGKYGEPTKAVRIPESQVEAVLEWVENRCYRLPFYECAVAAGLPSQAEDEVHEELDLNELLIRRPESTFCVRVAGSSMINVGIHHNDILVVDKGISPENGKIVIAAVNGELTVKRLLKEKGKVTLMPENEKYPPIEIEEGMELHIWGVVTNVIHNL